MKPKIPRCCSCCDAPLTDPERKHHFVGQRKAVLIQASGLQATISLCLSCEITPEGLPELWHRQTLLQKATQTEKRNLSIRSTEQDVPLGVLYTYERKPASE